MLATTQHVAVSTRVEREKVRAMFVFQVGLWVCANRWTLCRLARKKQPLSAKAPLLEIEQSEGLSLRAWLP